MTRKVTRPIPLLWLEAGIPAAPAAVPPVAGDDRAALEAFQATPPGFSTPPVPTPSPTP